MERESRTFDDEEGRWRAVEAWQTSSGSVLLYFLSLGEDGEPVDDDRRDRRAALEAGRRLADLEEAEMAELRAGGTRLTGTERRFRAPDGRPWLAQSAGPVWADGGVATGTTGVLFTALTGEVRRARTAGGHVCEAPAERVAAWWRDATAQDGTEGSAPDGRT